MAAEVVQGGWPHACVSNDVIEHHKSLKLQLELTVGVFWQRLSLKLAQVEIGVFVSINKELKGADLVGDSKSSESLISAHTLHYDAVWPNSWFHHSEITFVKYKILQKDTECLVQGSPTHHSE